RLDMQANPPGAPVSKIWLRAYPAPPRAAQTGLFLPLTPEPEKLELTLARISGIVGSGRCGSPLLLNSFRPEGFRVDRFSPPVPKGTSADLPVNFRPVTALRIFRPPVHVGVITHAGTPVRFTCRFYPELQGEIIWTAGPWKTSGEWWSQTLWQREEWEIAVQNKGIALYRLFQDMNNGDWFLEGSYD